MEFKVGEVETKAWAEAGHKRAANYLIQAQQCDLAAHLTEEMNKYPAGSPERTLLKAIRFGVAYGRGDQTINIHTDYSPEEMKTFRNPMFETKINKAVFLNQDIIVFPQDVKVPDNLSNVVRFLFGEGAVVTQDCVNNHGCIRITGATYVLNNVKTLNADWECTEVEG